MDDFESMHAAQRRLAYSILEGDPIIRRAMVPRGPIYVALVATGALLGVWVTSTFQPVPATPAPRIVEKVKTVLYCDPAEAAPEKVVIPETNPNVRFDGEYLPMFSSNPKIAKEQMARDAKITTARMKAEADRYKADSAAYEKRQDRLYKYLTTKGSTGKK